MFNNNEMISLAQIKYAFNIADRAIENILLKNGGNIRKICYTNDIIERCIERYIKYNTGFCLYETETQIKLFPIEEKMSFFPINAAGRSNSYFIQSVIKRYSDRELVLLFLKEIIEETYETCGSLPAHCKEIIDYINILHDEGEKLYQHYQNQDDYLRDKMRYISTHFDIKLSHCIDNLCKDAILLDRNLVLEYLAEHEYPLINEIVGITRKNYERILEKYRVDYTLSSTSNDFDYSNILYSDFKQSNKFNGNIIYINTYDYNNVENYIFSPYYSIESIYVAYFDIINRYMTLKNTHSTTYKAYDIADIKYTNSQSCWNEEGLFLNNGTECFTISSKFWLGKNAEETFELLKREYTKRHYDVIALILYHQFIREGKSTFKSVASLFYSGATERTHVNKLHRLIDQACDKYNIDPKMSDIHASKQVHPFYIFRDMVGDGNKYGIITKACKSLGISRHTGYRILEAMREGTLDELTKKSRIKIRST